MGFFYDKGNLADSPQVKRVKGGKDGEFVVAKMRVMFGRYGSDGDGGVVQTGGFWREVEIYGDKAHEAGRVLRKGHRVMVVGREESFEAHDDSGNPVAAFKIVADDIGLQITQRLEAVTYRDSQRYEKAAA